MRGPLEYVKMVSFSFLLRFGTLFPLLLPFLKSKFNFKDAFSSTNIICKSNRVLWLEKGKTRFTHTHTHLFLLFDPGDGIRSLLVTQPKLGKPWCVNPTGSLVQMQPFQNPRGGIFTVQIKTITFILNPKKLSSCTQSAFQVYSKFLALRSVPLNKPASSVFGQSHKLLS